MKAATASSRGSTPRQFTPQNKLRGLALAFAAGISAWALVSQLLPSAAAVGPAWRLLTHVAPSAVAVALAAACMVLIRQRSAQAHARTVQLLQVLLDSTADAVSARDADGRYLLFNRAAGEMAGVDPQAVLDQPDSTFSPARATAIRERDMSVMQLKQPQTYEETLETPSGPRTFLTTAGPLRDANGVFGVVSIARDITQMLQTRDELRRSELRFRLLVGGADVWDWDIAGGKALAQSSFWHQLGFEAPADDSAFEWLNMLLHVDDRDLWQRALRAHLKDRAPYVVEFRARHRNGGWRWFRTQGQAQWNEQGRAVYMAGSTYDVTDRREMEEALLRSRVELTNLTQRLMAQERETTMRLARSLHDELGQVLGGARLHMDLALAQADGPQGARRDRLERVSTLIDHAVAEVRRVLIALRPPVLREQGLAAALDNEIRHGTARGLPTQVLLHVDPQAAASRWPEEIEYAAFMIAREALTNALKHAQAQRVHITLSHCSGGFELRVDDDGVGIVEYRGGDRPGHLGLVGMRERAMSIGGLFAVERRLSGGTTARLTWKE